MSNLSVMPKSDLEARLSMAASPEAYYASLSQSERLDGLACLKKAKLELNLTRMAEIPDWDSIANDVGGVLSTKGGRDSDLIALRRGNAVFAVTHSLGGEWSIRELSVRAAGAGLRLVGSFRVPKAIFDLIYQQADQGSDGAGAEGRSDQQALFDEIGSVALQRRASDIHISWAKGRGSVQMRIHGSLEHYMDMSEAVCRDLINTAYNTLSESGSAKEGFNERQLQDAVIERVIGGQRVRFRYSGLPLANGYDVTLRVILIGGESKTRATSELGYAVTQHDAITRSMQRSGGIVIFVGATGSGKSTSMASFLSEKARRDPGKKIRSVEEPVECEIPGVAQTPVQRIKGDGSDFQDVLRQILRSDPDVVMIGEMRDQVTAELAIHAALTGHLVLTTLHTDAAALAFERLIGMGCNRSELATVGLISAIVFQRLLPELCPVCKVAGDSAEALGDPALSGVFDRLQALHVDTSHVYFRSKTGCPVCSGRSIKDRTVCAEVIRPTPKLLSHVRNGDSVAFFNDWRATRSGVVGDMTGCTAFEHAFLKMSQGLISPVDVEKDFGFIDELLGGGE